MDNDGVCRVDVICHEHDIRQTNDVSSISPSVQNWICMSTRN